METKTLAPLCQPGQPLFGIHASNEGRLIIFPGGIPLKDGGTVIGAIGVSGSTVEDDQAVAAAGVAALYEHCLNSLPTGNGERRE
jgi:uncharacterized protein GlcG (DUF336 family)